MLWHRCFPVKFAKFLRTLFLYNTSERLFLTPSKTSTVATTECLSKIPSRKKIFNEHFNLCEVEIYLDEIIKSINSEINNKPLGIIDGLTAEFYKHFSNKVVPFFSYFYDAWENLASWVLLIEQKSYRSNIKKVTKNILQTTDPYTTTLKNRLQKTITLFFFFFIRTIL